MRLRCEVLCHVLRLQEIIMDGLTSWTSTLECPAITRGSSLSCAVSTAGVVMRCKRVNHHHHLHPRKKRTAAVPERHRHLLREVYIHLLEAPERPPFDTCPQIISHHLLPRSVILMPSSLSCPFWSCLINTQNHRIQTSKPISLFPEVISITSSVLFVLLSCCAVVCQHQISSPYLCNSIFLQKKKKELPRNWW